MQANKLFPKVKFVENDKIPIDTILLVSDSSDSKPHIITGIQPPKELTFRQKLNMLPLERKLYEHR